MDAPGRRPVDPGVGIPFPWTVAGAWTVFALWALGAARRDQ
ncbi:hypothetical protein [Streptomyces niveus]